MYPRHLVGRHDADAIYADGDEARYTRAVTNIIDICYEAPELPSDHPDILCAIQISIFLSEAWF